MNSFLWNSPQIQQKGDSSFLHKAGDQPEYSDLEAASEAAAMPDDFHCFSRCIKKMSQLVTVSTDKEKKRFFCIYVVFVHMRPCICACMFVCGYMSEYIK